MWWRREKTEIAEFLYMLLVGDSPKGFARSVAERMGVPYPTLSKYWLGKRRFPASLIKPLFFATDQDPRVAEFFVLAGSDYHLERKTPVPTATDVPRAVIELGKLAGEVASLYLEASSNDALADNDRADLSRATAQLIERAEGLKAAFESTGAIEG